MKALDCGLYIPVFCSGELEQFAPACPDSCTSDSDCVSGAYCDGSLCASLGELGDFCVVGAGCASGNCVDGFCCETVCGGGAATDCQSCMGAQTGAADGVCAVIQAAADYECLAAGADSVCDPADICDGASAACPSALAPDGTACGDPASCAGSGSSYAQTSQQVCASGTCSGGGETTDCGGFTCDGDSCFTSCNSSNAVSNCDGESHCGDCSSSGATSCTGALCVSDQVSMVTVQSILDSRCNTCHWKSPFNHASMVGVNATTGYCSGHSKLLVPGDLDSSCIWDQIDVGGTMRSWSGITSGEVDTIRQWILEGAKDN